MKLMSCAYLEFYNYQGYLGNYHIDYNGKYCDGYVYNSTMGRL